jgi:hypothetical protein
MSLLLDHNKLGGGPRESNVSPPSPSAPVQPKKPRAWVSAIKVSSLSGLAVIILLVVVEQVAPARWKPSTYIGAFGGKVETVKTLESLDAFRAMTAMQEEERARGLQEVEQLRAAQERLTLAYRVEFERGNDLIRAGAAAAQQFLAQATEAKAKGMEGRFRVSAMKDEWGNLCDLGNFLFKTPNCGPKLRESAEADRNAMQAEIIEGWKSANAQIVGMAQTWAAGLVRPDELITESRLSGSRLYAAPREPIPPNPYRSE